MDQEKKTPKARSLQYYMRAIHRVLGYFVVGMVLAYAISGITLIHRTGNFLKKSVSVEQELKPGLNAEQLEAKLKIKGFKVEEETDEKITFAGGSYDKASGKATYEKKEVVSLVNKMIDLHKLADGKNPHIAFFTTLFGIALALLAITSLFMYKPSTKQFKANMIYTGAGVVLVVLLIVLM